MNYQNYQLESRATAIYPRLGNNLEYPALGLIDELGEVYEASPSELPKELSDVYWYAAQLCTELGLDLQETAAAITDPAEIDYSEVSYITLAFVYASKIAGRIKKVQRDYDGVCPPEIRQTLKELIAQLLYCLSGIVTHMTPYYVGQILQMNIDKLRDRQLRGVLQGNGDNR